jgi:serine protease Do
MKTLPRIAIAFSTVALAGLIFIEMHGQAAAVGEGSTTVPSLAQALAAQSAASNAAPAPLVNLPDFTELVGHAAPAVVNIEAKMGSTKPQQVAQQDGSSDDPNDDQGNGDDGPATPGQDDVPEFFKRFFGQPGGPGFPMPQRPRQGTSFGSGFIISADGYLLTNRHVIDGSDQIIVHLSDRRELKAKVIGSDAAADVALLKIEAGGLPVLNLGDSGHLKPGQWVVAIGSPFGFDHSVTAGVVSGLGRPSVDRSQQYVPFIQTDVAINPGNSGGPLMNTRGEVVGINSQIFSNSGGYMGVSFAIPIEVAMNAVRQIKETGHVTRGQLGVIIRDVQSEEMGDLSLNRQAGAFVQSVQNKSAAAKAGIQVGDVITSFNGRPIDSSSDLPPMVGAMAPGAHADVELLRSGKPMKTSVVLTALDASALNSAQQSSKAPPPPSNNNVIGVAVEELDSRTRGQLGLSAGEGVRVARISNPLLQQSGLSVGDVILQVGKTSVGSVAAFDAAVKGLKSGDRLRLVTRNQDSTGLITVTIP